jgi:hypothetical protein
VIAATKTTPTLPSPAKPGEGKKSEIGTVRYPRLVAKDAVAAEKLKKRTLTNLYNEMPTWLKNVHAKLDEAVFAAYGWDAGIGESWPDTQHTFPSLGGSTQASRPINMPQILILCGTPLGTRNS